jgi:hypothetical protein
MNSHPLLFCLTLGRMVRKTWPKRLARERTRNGLNMNRAFQNTDLRLRPALRSGLIDIARHMAAICARKMPCSMQAGGGTVRGG